MDAAAVPHSPIQNQPEVETRRCYSGKGRASIAPNVFHTSLADAAGSANVLPSGKPVMPATLTIVMLCRLA